MNDTSKTPLAPPKTSIFDRTLSGVQEEPELKAPSRGLLARLFYGKPENEEIPTSPLPKPCENPDREAAANPLGRPKVSIFDVTEHGVPEKSDAPTPSPNFATVPLAPVRLPKVSIFDKTEHGVLDAPEAPEAPIAPREAATPRVVSPRLPKVSIFDKTEHGVPDAPESSADPREAITQPVSAPRLPKMSIFDKTEHGVPDAPEAPADSKEAITLPGLPPRIPKASIPDKTEHGVPDVLEIPTSSNIAPEPPAEPVLPTPEPEVLPLIAAPAVEPVFDEAELSPSPADHALVLPETEDWDEGTAAEWNPRWAEMSKTLSLAEAASAEEPREELERPKSAGSTRVVLATLGIAAAALLMVLAIKPLFKKAAVAEASPAIPESLRDYYAKAESGDVASMRVLGVRYSYGIGAPLDRKEGVKWLRKAAQCGSPTAIKELVDLGVSPN